MSLGRCLGWFAVAVLGALVLGPLLALVPSALIDVGPGGASRATAFYLALAASDPFTWECAPQSLTMAVVVAAGSLALGVGLARALGRWRFWGRRPLGALGGPPLAVPPLFAAIGLDGLADRLGIAHSTLGEHWCGLLIWLWAELIGGVALVALVTRSALERIDPDWEDAARLAGADRRRIWRTVG